MKTMLGVISVHASASKETVVKIMVLSKIIGTFCKEFVRDYRQDLWMDKKTQLDTQKHDGGVIMLVLVLVRNEKY